MSSRRLAFAAACIVFSFALGACRQVITRGDPDPPPFPPALETVVTTETGLVFEASAEIVSTGPTAIRVTATVTNPTGEDLVARTLAEPCDLIVVASWQEFPNIRLVQPLDGLGFNGSALGFCTNMRVTRTIPAGQTIELMKDEDLVLSEVLQSTFEPGRYVLSAIFVDEFVYEVLALDTIVSN